MRTTMHGSHVHTFLLVVASCGDLGAGRPAAPAPQGSPIDAGHQPTMLPPEPRDAGVPPPTIVPPPEEYDPTCARTDLEIIFPLRPTCLSSPVPVRICTARTPTGSWATLRIFVDGTLTVEQRIMANGPRDVEVPVPTLGLHELTVTLTRSEVTVATKTRTVTIVAACPPGTR